MNLSRRELLKLGGAALVAPLIKRIPDPELPEHPLLSPVHKDISPFWHDMPDDYVYPPMMAAQYPPPLVIPHGGIHEIQSEDTPYFSDEWVMWTANDMYVSYGFASDDDPDWMLICSRGPAMSTDEWASHAESIGRQFIETARLNQGT